MDPSLAEFDPKIERTLLHIRQVRRRLDYTASAPASFEGPSETLVQSDSDLDFSFNEETSYSSVGTTDIPLSIAGDNHMVEPRRITLHEQGAPDLVFQPLQACGRHGLCFSLEGQSKEWFYDQSDAVVADWDLLRKEFLDKFFPPKRTDYIRKKIYGLCTQDKRLLNASSSGSLVKYKMTDEVWRLINDVAEATQHDRVSNNHPKSVAEVSSSDLASTKTLGEMTILLKQIHQGKNSSSSMQSI
ncbi:uncharacterized protein DS421_14g458430 [Arachis hypogaea]|nr:uncharacterized protein DS421_14g458430 [Arachis hypogaea]